MSVKSLSLEPETKKQSTQWKHMRKLHESNKTQCPAHQSVIAMAAVHNCGFELIDHLPYSPDLASSVFKLEKKCVAGKQY